MPSPASTASKNLTRKASNKKKKTGTSANKTKNRKSKDKTKDEKVKTPFSPRIVSLIRKTIDVHCMSTLEPIRNLFRLLAEDYVKAHGLIREQQSHLEKYGSQMSVKYKDGEIMKEKLVEYVPPPFRFNPIHIQMSENIRSDPDCVQISKDAAAAQDHYKKVLTELKNKAAIKELTSRKECMLRKFIDNLINIFTTIIDCSKGNSDLKYTYEGGEKQFVGRCIIHHLKKFEMIEEEKSKQIYEQIGTTLEDAATEIWKRTANATGVSVDLSKVKENLEKDFFKEVRNVHLTKFIRTQICFCEETDIPDPKIPHFWTLTVPLLRDVNKLEVKLKMAGLAAASVAARPIKDATQSVDDALTRDPTLAPSTLEDKLVSNIEKRLLEKQKKEMAKLKKDMQKNFTGAPKSRATSRKTGLNLRTGTEVTFTTPTKETIVALTRKQKAMQKALKRKRDRSVSPPPSRNPNLTNPNTRNPRSILKRPDGRKKRRT